MLRVRLLAAALSLLCSAAAAGAVPKGVGTAVADEAVVLTSESIRQVTPESIGGFVEVQDGTRILVLRVRQEGASAVRLHLAGLRLPEGVRLFVYGISNGAAVDVAGPWEGSGASAHGSFWTPAIRGSEAIIEIQADGEVPSDLPFEILEVEASEQGEPQNLGPSRRWKSEHPCTAAFPSPTHS